MAGEWKLIIEYIEGPGLIEYSHSVVISQVPYDFGLPMETFMVTDAYINFEATEKGAPSVSSLFRVLGDMKLRPGESFDHLQDPVTLQMGSYQETIPPGSFTPQGEPDNETYNYSNPDPEHSGIHHMIFNFKMGWFRAYATRVDMSGTGNPVMVRLAIGSNTGFEEILMDIVGNEWFYQLEGKTRAETLIAEGSLPAAFSLSQNYPNPFNATTQIVYSIPEEMRVSLALHNIQGQQVALLVDNNQPAGFYQITWDGRDAFGNQAASGIYFCHLRAGALSQTRKMLLLR
jgi:hypothetical protein